MRLTGLLIAELLLIIPSLLCDAASFNATAIRNDYYGIAEDSVRGIADSTHHIDEVVVTATRKVALATAQTLSGKVLQGLSSTSVADAMKYFAGVQIKDYGGLGGLKTVNVRSLGAQHVDIYIDGIRVTNALYII